jgi:hypothetical protein
MSDSLKATVIVIERVLTISAKDELEVLDELEPPRLPALPLDDADGELAAALVVEPAETESPGTRLDSETKVPLTGARSFVFASPVLAFWRLALALSTDASADAMLAADGVVLLDPPALDDGVLSDVVAVGVVVVGVDVVGVVVGVEVGVLGVVVVGVMVVGVVGVGVLGVVVVGVVGVVVVGVVVVGVVVVGVVVVGVVVVGVVVVRVVVVGVVVVGVVVVGVVAVDW